VNKEKIYTFVVSWRCSSLFGVQLCWSIWCSRPLRVPGFPDTLPWRDTSGKVCATCCSHSGHANLMPPSIRVHMQLHTWSSALWAQV